MNRERLNILSKEILDSCMAVHREMGPGLLESVYTFSLLKEFEIRGIVAQSVIALPLFYKGFNTGKKYEMDILVEQEIVLEIKSVEILHPVYEAQMISYLKLSGKCLGFLINFNVPLLKNGFKRFVNNF